MDYKLTNCLQSIMSGSEVSNPILQILGQKKINSGSKERYRLILSDGVHTISHAMLACPNNLEIIEGGEDAIIKITRYMTSCINNTPGKEQRILLILNAELVEKGSKVGRHLGNPVPLTDVKSQEVSKSSTGTTSTPSYTPSNNSGPMRASTNNASTNNTSLDGQMIHPISSLSPYQNRWIIKARVTNKSPIRTWSNSKGEGKLFNIDLVDESGEIRCTGFRDMVDKYFDYIQIDKVYFISKCQLKPANKQFSSLKNDYEMTMSNETLIQECLDDNTGVPTTKYCFTTIDNIANMEVGSLIDICAICKSEGDIQTFQAKSTGRELKKKEIVLVDQSNNSINLTLWGTEAENFNGTNNPVVVIKGAKLGEFGGGKNVSCLSSSLLKINPDIPESFRIRGWYDQEGYKSNTVDISMRTGGGSFSTPWMSFKEVKDQGLGNSEKGDYYQAVGTILLMRSENLTYKACPTESCNKKIIDLENGMFRCEKCNREYPNFKYRLLSSMNVGDWSGNIWTSMFTSEAETILGMSAQDVGNSIENDPESAAKIVENVNFKQYLFKCRAKMETYNDEARLKTIVMDVKPINYKEYNNQLITRIKQLLE